MWRMLFYELYKIMVNKATFVGFRGGYRPPGSVPAEKPLAAKKVGEQLANF